MLPVCGSDHSREVITAAEFIIIQTESCIWLSFSLCYTLYKEKGTYYHIGKEKCCKSYYYS